MLNNPFVKHPTKEGELYCSTVKEISWRERKESYSASSSDSKYLGTSPTLSARPLTDSRTALCEGLSDITDPFRKYLLSTYIYALIGTGLDNGERVVNINKQTNHKVYGLMKLRFCIIIYCSLTSGTKI